MLVSLSPLTLYSSSHHSSLIGTLSCVGTVQKNLGKLTLIGARGQPWGFSFAVRGPYAQNVPWGPLQGFFVVLVALFGVCGAGEPKATGRRPALRDLVRKTDEVFGP